MSYVINMNTVSFKVFCAINDLDNTLVGTKDYIGLAYFWGSNGTKHYLREATISQRKKIHNLWIKEKLNLTEDSPKHYEIIKKVIK